MSVASLEFLVLTLLLSATFFLLPSASSRRWLLTGLNGAALATLLPNLWSWIALGLFLASGYAAAVWLAARPRLLGLWAYLGALVAVFVVLRRYGFLGAILPPALLDHPVKITGLSYMLFRQIHFVVDVMQAQIRRPSFWRYLNYQLNLFGILSGPIQRFQDFDACWSSLEPLHHDRHELLRAHLRILIGILQVTVVGAACLNLYTQALQSTEWSRTIRIPAVFYSYPAYVYFNFTGYCSIVIGAASLVGMRMPENFDRPYLARNMLDFWNRWHVTLSHWLRDYLFTPIYKWIAESWPRRAATLAPACYFFVFLVAGIWHGTTFNFAVFGLLHGAGVFAAKWWENRIVRVRGRKGLREYLRSRRVGVVARLATFHFACGTFLFFPSGLHHCLDNITSLFIATAP